MNSLLFSEWAGPLHPRPSILPCPQVGPPSSSEAISLSFWAYAEQALFLSVGSV